jgi:NAD kinase
MQRLSERKIVLVTRKTRIDELLRKYNTISQAKFYIEHLGDDFEDYQTEHKIYYESLKICTIELSKAGRLQQIDRSFLPNYTFGEEELVVVLGQDGLVANSLKYLNGHYVVGINPDPARWDGILLPFEIGDLSSIIPEIVANRRPAREVTMAKASLNTGESLLAVNDFFIGPKSHTSARYLLETRSKSEEQSSSGIIVSTGLGSTGWFKSLISGATGINKSISGRAPKINLSGHFTWESDYLYFTVREPFPSKFSKTDTVFGKITKSSSLKLTSRMPGNGVIFSDGIESDFIEFNSGSSCVISLADKKGQIVQ